MSYQSHTTEAGIKSLIVEIGPDANVRIILGWTDKNAHLPFLQKQLRSEEERLKSGSSKSDYWIKQLQKEMKQPRNRPLEIDLTSSYYPGDLSFSCPDYDDLHSYARQMKRLAVVAEIVLLALARVDDRSPFLTGTLLIAPPQIPAYVCCQLLFINQSWIKSIKEF